MPHQVLQSSTQGFYIFADDADAYGEGLSGLSISVSLSKGGGAFNAVSPTITDLGDGVYWVAPLATHRDTLGEIAWKFSATGAIIASRFERVVVVNDQVAQWGVPDAVLAAAAVTPINANVIQVNNNPANPSTNVAQQTTLLTLVDLVNSLEGEGLYAINVELQSSEGPVGKVIINIVGTNLTRVSTNSGLAQFPVNPGTYTLRFDVPYGYAPIPDQTVVVTAADVTKEIEMTLTTVTPPSDPSLCDLYGRVVGSDGARLKDVEVKAILSRMVKNVHDAIPMATLLETKTGEDGTFNLTLMRFASYELTFTTPEAKRKTVKVQIGDQPTALISTVIR